jgi:hypothetical protein
LWDLTRPVDPGSDPAVREAFGAARVEVTDSDALLGSRE